MLGSSYKVATVWGIPIRIHISLIVLLVFFAVSMGLAGGPKAIALLLVLESGIFGSIALHELGHSFVAMRKGCRVREITLMFIGGAAQMEEIPEKPADEFQMAIAGPAVSILLGFGLWIGGAWLPLAANIWPVPMTRSLGVHCNVVQFIGVVNFGLAAFNLLPAFPMDGGRVLRALLVRRKGRVQATRIAALLGKIMAAVLGYLGITSLPGGWFLLLLAFFLYSSAQREYQIVVLQERMRSERVQGWSFGGWRPPGGPVDRAVVSPPPYIKGPSVETEIRPDGEIPFRRRPD